ncbi:MAG: hypothetical protein ACRDZP_08040 [Acidimicrobiales bacterium]
MRASTLPGLASWVVVVRGSRVTITGVLKVQLIVVGMASLSETRSAALVYGE